MAEMVLLGSRYLIRHDDDNGVNFSLNFFIPTTPDSAVWAVATKLAGLQRESTISVIDKTLIYRVTSM